MKELSKQFILTLLEVVIKTGRVRDVLAEAGTAAGEYHWVLTLGQSDDEVAETLVLAFERSESHLKHETQEEARGILIAEDFSTRVKRAVVDDNVELYRLKLNPGLEAI